MSKYRIKYKKEKYQIQKKFIFWFNYNITTHCNINIDLNSRPNYGAMLIKRRSSFDNENMAKDVLNKLQNKFKEKYKDNKIRTVFSEYLNDSKLTDMVYINKSNWRPYPYSDIFEWIPCYEYSSTLDGLKQIIDERKNK